MSASAPESSEPSNDVATPRSGRTCGEQVADPRSLFVYIALFCITLILFAPARHYEYISLDDPLYTQPIQVRNGWTWEGVRWAFTTGQAANWHPVTWLSHMTDAQLFGDAPGGAHLVNAVLHAINAMLVFGALNVLTRQPWPSAIVAALFAVHPLRVESVAWVAERKDLLCALFFLLMLLAYERFARRGGAVNYALVLLAFVLGLLAKPMLVTVPFVLLLLDCWPLKRPARFGRLVLEKVPLLAFAVVSSVVTFLVQRHAGAMRDEIYPFPLRLQNALLAYGRYLGKTIWPTKLAVFYPYEGALPGTSISVASVIVSAVVLLVMTAAAVWLWKRERAVLVGWLWFLGMLVPVIGIVQVGFQSLADRYTYLPHIGLFTAIVFGVARFAKPIVGVILSALTLLALILVTHAQLGHWRDSITLFTHALAVTDHNHLAHNNLGYTYMSLGRYADAIGQFEQVIAIDRRKAEPYYNIGLSHMEMGRLEQAEQWFGVALNHDAKYVAAHINLGNVLLAQKKLPFAILQYRRAVELAPTSFLPQYNLALAIAQQQGDAVAVGEFEKAVKLDPNHAEARYSYAMGLRAAGRDAEATRQFQQAAKLAQAQGLTDLAAEIQRQLNNPSPLPKPTTNPENLRQ